MGHKNLKQSRDYSDVKMGSRFSASLKRHYILGLAYNLMIARGKSRAVDLRPKITKLQSMRYFEMIELCSFIIAYTEY